MSTTIDILSKVGLTSIGMCSTLWINPDGSFRAGLFRYRSLLHLVVFLEGERFWVTSVSTESVEICLRGGSSLMELASNSKHSYVLTNKQLIAAEWLERIRLWWVLRTNRTELLPNYYYLWNAYRFSVQCPELY